MPAASAVNAALNSGKQSCYLCSGSDLALRHHGVRDNPDTDVLECGKCGLVSLYHQATICDGFYEDGGMRGHRPADSEAWEKRAAADDDRRFEFSKPFILNRSLLDFGCGSGGFLLRARSMAREACGLEIDGTWQSYHEKKGLKIFRSLDEVRKTFEVITLFHVLEHLRDPRRALADLGGLLDRGGQVIVEVPSANDALYTLFRSAAFSDFSYWSCHLFLFTPETLVLLARQAGFKVQFMSQVQRYPLSNHLHWLARGEKGGHLIWSFLDSPELRSAYENRLASLGICDTLVAGLIRSESVLKPGGSVER